MNIAEVDMYIQEPVTDLVVKSHSYLIKIYINRYDHYLLRILPIVTARKLKANNKGQNKHRRNPFTL